MEDIKVEYLSIEQLKKYENNAKIHTPEQIEQIKNSIQEFGMNDPIAVWKNNEIIEGHGRLIACQQLGIKKVPVIRLDKLTDEQRKAYGLVHNKLTMNTDFDFSKLDEELASLDDIDMSLFGFEENIEIEEPHVIIEDDFSEDVPSRSSYGQVWVLGKHRLMCGDSTKEEDVAKLMGDERADLFLTDPPYNVDYEGKTKDRLKIQNDKMENASFKAFLIDAFQNADIYMREGAPFYIWHADSEGYNFRGACVDVGWTVRQCLIWNKNSMVMGRQDYQWKHEPCLYGWKDGAGHNWYSDRKQTTVLDFNKPVRNDLHPTMKPVELFSYQIQNSTKQGDKVLDLFGGSGTTLIASEQINRNCYMMELDPHYVDVILERWENITGEKAVLLNDNA